jgi:two-component system cell cycle response regulator CtrA
MDDTEIRGPDADGQSRGRLTVNLDERRVEVDGNPIELTSKEFGILEILFRRSLAGSEDAVIKTGRLSLNLNTHRVEVDGRQVHLTSKEYAILEILSLRKGTTTTKVTLLDHLYDGLDEPEMKIIDVFICKLRKKLARMTGGETYIETVRGHGYRLRDPADAA